MQHKSENKSKIGAAIHQGGLDLITAKAFTLIELLVVVLIIGVLAAIAVPQYQVAVEKSRATEALIWAKHLAEAEELYYMANGAYTKDLNKLGITAPTNTYFKWDRAIDNSLYNVYLPSVKGEYTIRYFVQHLGANYQSFSGRLLCVAKEESKQGTAVCRALSGTTGIAYPLDDSSKYKMYPLN